MEETLDALTEESKEEFRNDATLVNVLTQMGTNSDRAEYTQIGVGSIIPKEKLEELYKIPICYRIARARPDSATIKGWDLILGGDGKQKIIPDFTKYHDNLRVREKFCEAQVLANVYGGAAIVIVSDDGKAQDQPLNTKAIKSIISLEVLDRYKICPLLDFATNPMEPEFYRLLLPEYLKKRFTELFPKEKKDYLIHHTRVIRFDGVLYTPDMMWRNNGWGGSVLECIWEDYRDWKTTMKAMAAMVHDCSLFVYKIKNLAEMVKTNQEELLKARLKLLRMMTSVFGGLATDAEKEGIEFPGRNFGGVDQIGTQLRDAFIGASGIPHDKLFGESPSGLGATGESEENNWAQDIAAFQQTVFYHKLRKIFETIFLAKDGPTKGNIPDDWSLTFKSILSESEQEKISNRSSQSSTDNTYISAGVLLPEEVRQSRFGGSEYSFETTLDQKLFEKKQKEAQAQQQQQSGGDDYSQYGNYGNDGQDQDGQGQDQEDDSQTEQKQDSVRTDAYYSQLEKKDGKVYYQGRWWTPNKPEKSTRTGKKRMVLAKKGDLVKIVHYGAQGYQHNYSESAKKNYLKRSAGIKNKQGQLTAYDVFSPNHWARKDLWNEKLPADARTTHQINKERSDSNSKPAKKIIDFQGIKIGVTHLADEDDRYGTKMKVHYGHVRGSYGDGEDGKSIDAYLHPKPISNNIFKVRQLNPEDGTTDEHKYFLGFSDPREVKDVYVHHVGSDRFGGVEACDPEELGEYMDG